MFAFSYINWDGARRRGMHFAEDRLAEALLEHPQVGKLVVADPLRSWPAALARRVRSTSAERFPADERVHHSRPMRVRRRDPINRSSLERAYRRYVSSLRDTAERHGLDRPALITTHPLVAGSAAEWPGPVTFYAVNDWTAHPEYAPWWAAFESAYCDVRARGHRVCGVTQTIIDRIRPTGPAAVVPNGVHLGEWLAPGPPPAWFEALPRPRLLYVGTVDERLRVDALERLSGEYPGGTVVVAGLISDRAEISALRKGPNVHVQPELPRAELPGVVAAAEVCLIPHAESPLTLAMSPLKLYEYLAAGRPVAGFDLPGNREVSPHVHLVPSSGDLSVAVRAALAAGPAPERERLAFMERNAWQRRHDLLLDVALA